MPPAGRELGAVRRGLHPKCRHSNVLSSPDNAASGLATANTHSAFAGPGPRLRDLVMPARVHGRAATRQPAHQGRVEIAADMTFMAGWIAEKECLGSCDGGDDDDRYQVDEMLNSLLPADADVPRHAARRERWARHIVRKKRPAIERVAAALLEQRTLDAAAVDRLIKG